MSKKERRHFRQRESAFAVSECISISEHPGAAGREHTILGREKKRKKKKEVLCMVTSLNCNPQRCTSARAWNHGGRGRQEGISGFANTIRKYIRNTHFPAPL